MSRTRTSYDAFVDDFRNAYDAHQQSQEEWVADETLTELSESINAEASNLDDDDDDEDDEAEEADEAEKAQKADKADKDDEDDGKEDDSWSEAAGTTSARLSELEEPRLT